VEQDVRLTYRQMGLLCEGPAGIENARLRPAELIEDLINRWT